MCKRGSNAIYKKQSSYGDCFFVVRLAAHVSNGWKSLIRPSSGKDTAKDKGVHREVESEGSRMANLWSDEQKSHQAIVKDKVANQTEVQ